MKKPSAAPHTCSSSTRYKMGSSLKFTDQPVCQNWWAPGSAKRHYLKVRWRTTEEDIQWLLTSTGMWSHTYPHIAQTRPTQGRFTNHEGNFNRSIEWRNGRCWGRNICYWGWQGKDKMSWWGRRQRSLRLAWKSLSRNGPLIFKSYSPSLKQ